MKTFSYYYATARLDHSKGYNLRHKTRKGLKKKIAESGGAYGEPTQVVVCYDNLLDLINQFCGVANPERRLPSEEK